VSTYKDSKIKEIAKFFAGFLWKIKKASKFFDAFFMK
jgi:hypothetical protein